MSPHPSRHNNPEEHRISVMEQAHGALSDLVRTCDDVPFDNEDVETLSEQVQEAKDEYFEERMQTAVSDYVCNHIDEVEKILKTDSLDERVTLLRSAIDTVMGRFNEYTPEEPSLDEMEEMLTEEYEEYMSKPWHDDEAIDY